MVPVLIAFVIAVMCSVVLFFANPTITRVIGDAEYGKSGKSGKRMKVDNAMAKAAKKEKVKMSFDFLLTTEKIIDKKYLPELLDDSHTCIEVSDIKHREKYMNSKNIMKTTLHNGQLKLLLTEIQFLTYILSSCYDKAYVIYAGSAPSTKLGILRIMFPNIKFHVRYADEDVYSDNCGKFVMEKGESFERDVANRVSFARSVWRND